MRGIFITLAMTAYLAPCLAHGADVRARIRVAQTGVKVSAVQATDLTLTLTEAAPRSIQAWIRTVGVVAADGKTVSAKLHTNEAEGLQPGQRVRGFAASARTLMHQGKIVALRRDADDVRLQIAMTNHNHPPGARYLLEIVAERGTSLSVPNAAIIDEGGEKIVYVEMQPPGSGVYAPRTISTGIQGEMFTVVDQGLFAGDRVVTIGSFFVNAEEQLKQPGMAFCRFPRPKP